MSSDGNHFSGLCDQRFSAVAHAFEANFAERGELGASVAVWWGGRKVVDLWGGRRSTAHDQPWTEDTVVNIWSSAKGLTGICFALLAQRGVVSYDETVAAYWPEFAVHGKGAVTVAMLLSHQAGLPGFDTPATLDDVYADSAAQRLAAQAPMWPPGSAAGYHTISVGTLASELCRRTDGRSLREFVAEEFGAGLGLDMAIGVGPGQQARLADLDASPAAPFPADSPILVAAGRNPGVIVEDPLIANSPAWRAAELPSANGTSNARGLGDLYSRMLASSPAPLVGPQVAADATMERWAGRDLVNGQQSRWAAGFQLNVDGLFGPGGPSVFGHYGRGGSVGFADPDADIAVAYTMNRMADGTNSHVRAMPLIEAVYSSL